MIRLRGQRGAVELIVAFALVAILGFAALIVDIGNAKQTRRNFQTAADSGSLAGANQLVASVASAQTFAEQYAFDSMNQPRGSTVPCPAGQTSDPTVPSANTTCYKSSAGAVVYVTTPYTFTPPAGEGISAPSPQNAINVTICQTLQTTFARVLGINSTHPCNSATAELVPGSSAFPCAVCVMSKTADPAFNFKGGGQPAPGAVWTVSGGIILVNSSSNGGIGESGGNGHPNAICDQLTPQSTTCDGGITWYGCTTTCPVAGYGPNPTNQPTQIPDPLAWLPVPSFATPAGSCTGNTCTPGVYTTSITGNKTLQPGNYVLVGPNVTLNPGQGNTISGTGVTIYLACASYPTPCATAGQVGAAINYNGGTVNIAAPTSTGASPLSSSSQTEKGLAIYADRNNTGAMFSLGGNSHLSVKGTIYGLNAQVSMGGTPGATFDSTFVVGTMEVHGTLGADNEVPADQVQLPPTSSAINLIG